MLDAVVVGSGPNGLAAAIVLAQSNFDTTIYESSEKIGGGMRSASLTLPGFVHDVCSSVHPLALASPFFQKLPLEKFGLSWVKPDAALANPFDDGSCAVLYNSLEETARSLDRISDSRKYSELFLPKLKNFQPLLHDVLGPVGTRLPTLNPVQLISFALNSVKPVHSFAKNEFQGKDARALLGGLAAHSMLRLEDRPTMAFAMIFVLLAHSVGWPFPRGGSQSIADSLGRYFDSLGGKMVTGLEVKSLDDLPRSRVKLFDLTPRQLLKIFGSAFPANYSKSLRSYRYGPGVFKLDYALDSPIPWKSSECLKASTVHVCGDLDEIALSEQTVWEGKIAARPFVIVTQNSLFDSSRAPEGKHTAWAYCHIPSGSGADLTERIENQIERFAPGFKSCVLARHSFTAIELEKYNANYVGGDINGGVQDLWQTFARPVLGLSPYKTPLKGIYICSSSTPPGGGVHGMCGFHAAIAAIKNDLPSSRR